MMQRLFTCAICRRDVVDYPDRKGRDRQLAPLCRYCEGTYADKGPKAGAFMDRRRVAQLSAVMNTLLSEAHVKLWERRYGRA